MVFVTFIAYFFRKLFSTRDRAFNERFRHSITDLKKATKEYMRNITSIKEKVNVETSKNDKIVKLPLVLKLRPNFKFGIKITFTSGSNLKNLICRNKSKLLPNSFPGVYQLGCTSNAQKPSLEP